MTELRFAGFVDSNTTPPISKATAVKIKPSFFVPLNEIKPNSIALLPPETC